MATNTDNYTKEILKPISKELIGTLEHLFDLEDSLITRYLPVRQADSDDIEVGVFRPTPTLRHETNQIRFNN